ncbi:MAG: sensor histidine kinase [Aristaeellaceae bacterium]
MYAKKETRFRDEIRRIVLLYALWPLLAAAVLVILIIVFVWVNSSRNAARDAFAGVHARLEQITLQYDEKLSEIAESLDMERFREEINYQSALKADIYRFVNAHEEKGAFYLFASDGTLLFSSERDRSERERLLSQMYWRVLRMLKEGGQERVITMCHETWQGKQHASLLIGRVAEEGYVCFALPASEFEAHLAQQPAHVIVTNAFGAIYLQNTAVFNAPLGKIDTRMEDCRGLVRRDRDFYYVYQGEALAGMLCIYAVKSVGELIYMVLLMSALVTIMLTVLIAVILISTRNIARKKTQTIDEIVQAFQKAQRGELTTRLEIHSNDEFEIIGEAYNSMLDSIRELIDRNVLQAQETAVSRVCQLEAQFNPHFLFNTLENVRFMVRRDPKMADTMILSLSRLLRYSIRSDTRDVTLQEDLSYVYNYLGILKFRFGDRLSYRIYVPEELENCRLPKLIMQPILENAIIHGMDKQEKLHIDVRFCVRDGMFCITVQDDGPGIPQDKYEMLLEKMGAENIHVGKHMGMLNVHYRLRLMYGTRSGLRIHTGPGKGTQVMLVLPLMMREGEELQDAEGAHC